MATKIRWTDETWNPSVGCTIVSDGCRNCYAMGTAHRGGSGTMHPGWWSDLTTKTADGKVIWNGTVRLGDDAKFLIPKKWKSPKKIFVNSMSDLFHADIPLDFITKIFDVAMECPQHTFQILTKRAERLAEVAPQLEWHPNIWMGVSVENDRWLSRVDYLRTVPAAIRFISAEPLIGPLTGLDLTGIGWVIVGGESGRRFRPMQEAWGRDLMLQCAIAKVPFFFKQWVGTHPGSLGHELFGAEFSEFPETAASRSAVDLLRRRKEKNAARFDHPELITEEAREYVVLRRKARSDRGYDRAMEIFDTISGEDAWKFSTPDEGSLPRRLNWLELSQGGYDDLP